jgi:hypothetical protein
MQLGGLFQFPVYYVKESFADCHVVIDKLTVLRELTILFKIIGLSNVYRVFYRRRPWALV